MTTLHSCIQSIPLTYRPSTSCGSSVFTLLVSSLTLSFFLLANVSQAASFLPQMQNNSSISSLGTTILGTTILGTTSLGTIDSQKESHISREEQQANNNSNLRIVSLAPHLTEWAYSLGLGPNLVAVSDYSDYPEQAKSLPRIADYQGADIAAILALHPDLVLVWKGGNKPQDIQKLSSLGLKVFNSEVTQIDDIPSELIRLGALTHTRLKAKILAKEFSEKIAVLKSAYSRKTPKNVFYYSWSTPLMTIGPKAWPNKLLNVCGAQTAFYDSPVDYPQVSVSEVLIRQVDVIIAASNQSEEALSAFWEPHSDFLEAELVTVDPDITSRFSLRLADELKRLCHGIN